jgi:hypothetical protein
LAPIRRQIPNKIDRFDALRVPQAAKSPIQKSKAGRQAIGSRFKD